VSGCKVLPGGCFSCAQYPVKIGTEKFLLLHSSALRKRRPGAEGDLVVLGKEHWHQAW
jgi:hypothetical protein